MRGSAPCTGGGGRRPEIPRAAPTACSGDERSRTSSRPRDAGQRGRHGRRERLEPRDDVGAELRPQRVLAPRDAEVVLPAPGLEARPGHARALQERDDVTGRRVGQRRIGGGRVPERHEARALRRGRPRARREPDQAYKRPPRRHQASMRDARSHRQLGPSEFERIVQTSAVANFWRVSSHAARECNMRLCRWDMWTATTTVSPVVVWASARCIYITKPRARPAPAPRPGRP